MIVRGEWYWWEKEQTSALESTVGGRNYAPVPLHTVQNAVWVAGLVWTDPEKRLSPTLPTVPKPDRPTRSESLH